MKPQGRELKLRMKGEDVAQLQETLTALGHSIPADEKAKGYFGPGTRQAVRNLQKQHGLKAAGVVDAATAEAIGLGSNEATKAVGSGYLVQGRVLNEDGTPATDVSILVVDKDVGGENVLGTTRTGKSGHYKFGYTEAQFRRSKKEKGGADLVVSVLDPDGGIIFSSSKHGNAPKSATIDMTLKAAPPSSEKYVVVRGALLNPDGLPIPSATVKAFDRVLREEILLRDAVTNAEGKYEIVYMNSQLRPKGKSVADLVIRAYGQDGNELAHSDLLCQASSGTRVDLVVGNASLRSRSEYDQLLRAITPYLGETKLADLERDDVAYLSCSTKVDRVQVATLVVANRLARDTGLPDWLFYALGRQGMLLQLPALQGHSLKHLRESIERAIEGNIVAPLADAAELDRWVSRLGPVLLKTAFEASAEPGRLSMGELLGASLAGREVQEAFLSRYLAREGSLDDFWRGLEEDESFDPAAREEIRFTLHLGMLTQYHAPLMLRLKELRQRGEFKSLRDLAGFDRKRWRQLLEASASGGDIVVPPDTPGQTPEERVNHYITTLREPIEALFPSDSLRHALTLAADTDAAVKTFLTNTPKLDLYWTDIDRFLAENGDSAFAGIAEEQRPYVVNEVKTMQRLLRVAPSADQVRILGQMGLTSAYAIARSSRRKFRALFAEVAEDLKGSLDGAYMVPTPSTDGVPGGETQMMLLSGKTPETWANMVLNQASGKAAAALNYVVNLKAILQYEGPQAVIGPKKAQEQAKNELLKKNPNLETLFGSLSYCECQHCRSVYSPAAYFVDLLHWLDNLKYPDALNAKTMDGKAKAPISVLLSRRPDLQHIALTCENTNTTLPYIDVVNEVLESFTFMHLLKLDGQKGYAWSDSPVGDKTLEARDTGAAKAEELRAVPQYIIPQVYEYLATKAVFPMTLPFHRSLEVMRSYLGHLGTSRAEIMEVFQAGTSDEDLSRERLGLSTALAGIITGSGDLHVWWYYGLANEIELQSKLTKVPEFLSRTGLSMVELTELLKTRFINPKIFDMDTYAPEPPPKQTIQIIVDPEEPCDTSRMTLKDLTWTDTDVLHYQWLNRIHRFLRLWRALGWPIPDVDRAIHTFGDKLDTATLGKFERLQRLKEELKQPVENLLACWGDLDTWGPDSLYDRLFFSKGLVPEEPQQPQSPSPFRLQSNRSEVDDSNQALENHLPAIFSALQLTMADYEAIKSVEKLDVLKNSAQSPALTLRNLSLLYRYGVLARSLNLRIKDIATLKRLVPDDRSPVEAGDPAATVRFVQLARTIQETAFSVPLLNYLFRHEEEPTRHPAPTRVLIVNTLKTIAEGLAQVTQETQPSEDPLGEELRTQLGLLAPLLTAPKPDGEDEYIKEYIKPEEIQQTVDMIDWRRSDFDQDAGKAFISKLHHTLSKDLGSSFLGQVGSDPDAALSALFPSSSPPTTPDECAEQFTANVDYLRDRLLPWLRERRQRSLVSQSLAAALGLDQSVAKTLVERVLHSAATDEPALAAFLDLQALDAFLDSSCTLTLLKHSVRRTPDSQNPEPDFATIQSIATSGGRNDAGLFELSFRDERRLPFEGAGVISTWRLELPSKFRQFDYDTISDIIFHINYTALEGGSKFKQDRLTALKNALEQPDSEWLFRAFNLREEFPDEWYRLLQGQTVEVTIGGDRLPYFASLLSPSIKSAVWLATTNTDASPSLNVASTEMTFQPDQALGGYWWTSDTQTPPAPPKLDEPFKVTSAHPENLAALWLLIVYKVEVKVPTS